MTTNSPVSTPQWPARFGIPIKWRPGRRRSPAPSLRLPVNICCRNRCRACRITRSNRWRPPAPVSRMSSFPIQVVPRRSSVRRRWLLRPRLSSSRRFRACAPIPSSTVVMPGPMRRRLQHPPPCRFLPIRSAQPVPIYASELLLRRRCHFLHPRCPHRQHAAGAVGYELPDAKQCALEHRRFEFQL